MRIEILANNRASFVQPMAEGLARMLKACGAEARIHENGLAQLMRSQSVDASSIRRFAGSTARLRRNRREFSEFVELLRGADAIVVVANVPGSFSPTLFPNIELLRARLPEIPIVNYDLHYLPTLDIWSRALLRNEKTGLSKVDLEVFSKGRFGMERYDWYLMASVGSYVPLPPGPHPYSLIGLNLDDGSLYPDQQGEFRILLDFEQERGTYPAFRRVQLEALRRSGLAYEVLDGHYTRDAIRSLYRRSSVLILTHEEGFGLPICEVQACGAQVFLADPRWAPAHWLGDDVRSRREPRLSPNFVVYENDPDRLAEGLKHAAARSNPSSVRETFLREQPELYYGDRSELQLFLEKLTSGAIHSKTHREHVHVGRGIDAHNSPAPPVFR